MYTNTQEITVPVTEYTGFSQKDKHFQICVFGMTIMK